MKHLFVPYELALSLKEKGFDEPCLAAYDGVEMLCTHSKNVFSPLNYNSPSGGHYASAPLYQEVIDWLREKKRIQVAVNSTIEANEWHFDVLDMNKGSDAYGYHCFSGYKSYYEALYQAIEEAIKFI